MLPVIDPAWRSNEGEAGYFITNTADFQSLTEEELRRPPPDCREGRDRQRHRDVSEPAAAMILDFEPHL